MSQTNPFQVTMARLQLPPGMGASISLRGFTLDADEENTVLVPKDDAPMLIEAHGLSLYVEKPAAAAKASK